MRNEIKLVLRRLRDVLGARTERAYTRRDDDTATAQGAAYAAGEAHAFGTAEEDVREAQKRNDEA